MKNSFSLADDGGILGARAIGKSHVISSLSKDSSFMLKFELFL
jgi:hypothetical protein